MGLIATQQSVFVDLLIGFASALLISIAVMPVLMHYAGQLKLVDSPAEERRVHQVAIPRVGGLGIALSAAISVAYWSEPGRQAQALFLAGLLIVYFGYLDDRFGLRARWKLLGQALAVGVAMAGGVLITRVPLLGLDPAAWWIAYPLTAFFLLGAINAVNLSDGLDGLAAGTMLLSLAFIAIGALQADLHWVALVALGVMGGLLGFLRFNTHPARVFMGDAGSQFLGFVVASLAILVTQSETCAMSPVLPLLILGLPVLDTLLVICIRVARGRPVFQADNSHTHHQLLRVGLRHYEVVAVLYCIQAIFIALAWQLRYAADGLILLVYGLFCVVFVALIGAARSSGWKLRADEPAQGYRDRRNHWLRRLWWAHVYGPVVVAMLLAIVLCLVVLLADGISPEIARLALACGLVAAPVVYFSGGRYDWLTRAVSYPACVFCVYLVQQGANAEVLPPASLDIMLGTLALFLVLAIRVTRRVDFRLDTQDLLMLLLLLGLPLLPFDSIDRLELGRFAIRLAVLLYACEYVISTKRGGQGVLRWASVASLLLLGAHSFWLGLGPVP